MYFICLLFILNGPAVWQINLNNSRYCSQTTWNILKSEFVWLLLRSILDGVSHIMWLVREGLSPGSWHTRVLNPQILTLKRFYSLTGEKDDLIIIWIERRSQTADRRCVSDHDCSSNERCGSGASCDRIFSMLLNLIIDWARLIVLHTNVCVHVHMYTYD